MRCRHMGWALGTTLLGLVSLDCIHDNGANTRPLTSSDPSEMHDSNDPTQAHFDTRRKEEMGSQYGTTMPGAKTRKSADDEIGGNAINTRRDAGAPKNTTGWHDDSGRQGEAPAPAPDPPRPTTP